MDMPEGEPGCRELDHGRVVASVGFFVAGDDAPELVTIAEEAFDELTPFGETIWRCPNRRKSGGHATGLRRDDGALAPRRWSSARRQSLSKVVSPRRASHAISQSMARPRRWRPAAEPRKDRVNNFPQPERHFLKTVQAKDNPIAIFRSRQIPASICSADRAHLGAVQRAKGDTA
jgi:hypothetical protein